MVGRRGQAAGAERKYGLLESLPERCVVASFV
jgi:hypothetical protein